MEIKWIQIKSGGVGNSQYFASVDAMEIYILDHVHLSKRYWTAVIKSGGATLTTIEETDKLASIKEKVVKSVKSFRLHLS